ncbi:MAG: phosphatidylglycerophosphatase A family protein [Terriglobales bacterium]
MRRRYSIAVTTAFPRQATAWERVLHLFAIGGPIGFIPWVPATWASLATAAVCWLAPPRPAAVVAITVALALLGGFTASTAERLLQTQDPRNVVIDEIAGQLLTFVFVAPVNWRLALAGFVLFRLLDVFKPFPARQAERLPGGWGILADDLVAGFYAAVVVYALRGVLG